MVIIINNYTNELQAKSKRVFSIDLLRILAMWLIICNHILVHGGVFEQTNSVYYYCLFLLWNLSIMAVNLYVLISGFFLITQKFKLSKLVHIYLEVVFYALLWYIYALTFGLESFSFLTFLFNIICPFSSEQYWFISAYIVMYLLSPLLNFLILKMNKHQHLTACLLLLFLFSFWVDIYPVRNQNIFNLSNGYSFHWFIVLYFIAAYLRLHIDLNKWKHTVIFSIFAYIIISVLSISTNLFNSVFPLVSDFIT